MEVFFERLNEGDVAGAVALMDERTEMRIHVGDNARTLRGVEQVGGWFLRADKGIKMIPGDVRDLGNTYQADLVVLRPGAPSQHLDAKFRVEAGKITSINLTPSLTARPSTPALSAPGAGGRRRRAAVAAGSTSGSGTGMLTESPTPILFGFLIFGFAASSASIVTPNFFAILSSVSPRATM